MRIHGAFEDRAHSLPRGTTLGLQRLPLAFSFEGVHAVLGHFSVAEEGVRNRGIRRKAEGAGG